MANAYEDALGISGKLQENARNRMDEKLGNLLETSRRLSIERADELDKLNTPSASRQTQTFVPSSYSGNPEIPRR